MCLGGPNLAGRMGGRSVVCSGQFYFRKCLRCAPLPRVVL
jgi:hypothetical protein